MNTRLQVVTRMAAGLLLPFVRPHLSRWLEEQWGRVMPHRPAQTAASVLAVMGEGAAVFAIAPGRTPTRKQAAALVVRTTEAFDAHIMALLEVTTATPWPTDV